MKIKILCIQQFRIKCCLFIFLLFFNTIAQAEIRTWTGGIGAGKNWAAAANWGGAVPVSGDDIVFNTPGDISFVSATLPPDISFFNSITIVQGAITLSAGGITRYFIIGGNNGVDFTIATGATLTIENGMSIYLGSSSAANINGTLNTGSNSKYNTDQQGCVTTVNGTIKATFQGSLICNNPSRLLFTNGSFYIHNKADGVIPSAIWNTASNCRIFTSAGLSLSITGFDQSFGNLIFQTGQSNAFYIDASLNIAGDLSIVTTGTSTMAIRSNAGARTINIGGSYIQSGGHFIANAGTGGTTMSVAGNFSMSGFTRIFSLGDGSTNSSITVTGNTLLAKGSLMLSTGANTGTFIIKGNLTHSSGSITELSTGAGEIVFNGNAQQTYDPTGSIVENTINFTVDNTSGVILAGSVSFPNSLTLTNGILTINAGSTLLLNNHNSINSPGFNANRHIATQVNNTTGNRGFLEVHKIQTFIPYLFPIGDGVNYLPVTLTSAANPSKNKYKICVFNGVTNDGLPNGIPVSMAEKDKSVNAVWNVLYSQSPAILVPPFATISFNWPSALEGTVFSAADNGLIGVSQNNLGAWAPFAGVGNNTSNTATLSNIQFTSLFCFIGLRTPVPL